MDFETISYSVEDRVATVAFNRPDQLNAITLRMKDELGQAFAAAEADKDVWLLIVTGNGRAFCAGADVNEIPEDGGNIYAEPYLSTYEQWEAPQEATPPFRTMTKPIIAAVNGLCCGAGLDLVTTSDIVIASDRAQFFDPHVSIGQGLDLPLHEAEMLAESFRLRGDQDERRAVSSGKVRRVTKPETC